MRVGSIVDAEFTSVWDGETCITTSCLVNKETKQVFAIEQSETSTESLNTLEREFVVVDGEEYPVFTFEEVLEIPEHKDDYWYLP